MRTLNHSSCNKATMVSGKTPTLSTMVDYWTRLSAALEHAGVTKTQLQTHLGVSYQAMKKVEEGKTKSLSAENNAKAARFLGVNSYWLATGEESMLEQAEPAPAYRPNEIRSAQEKKTASAAQMWPFEDVSPTQYQMLSERQKGGVEGYIQGMLKTLETRAA